MERLTMEEKAALQDCIPLTRKAEHCKNESGEDDPACAPLINEAFNCVVAARCKQLLDKYLDCATKPLETEPRLCVRQQRLLAACFQDAMAYASTAAAEGEDQK